jgi:hypothetical protein
VIHFEGLAISAILRRRSRTAFSMLPCLVLTPPTNPGVVCGRVSAQGTDGAEWDAGLARHDVILRRLVFARQGRARTLGDGVLGARLLFDWDGVGGDHGVFVIVECEYLGRDFHADGVAFTAITVHYGTHACSFTSL